ncbi:hypothetical protein AMECASPLE_030153, partial [Ameca splendens]
SGLGGRLVPGLAFQLCRDCLDFFGPRSLCAAVIDVWLRFGGGAGRSAWYEVQECLGPTCSGASGTEVWGWWGARSLARCGDLPPKRLPATLASCLALGCGHSPVGGAVERVLYLDWES